MVGHIQLALVDRFGRRGAACSLRWRQREAVLQAGALLARRRGLGDGPRDGLDCPASPRPPAQAAGGFGGFPAQLCQCRVGVSQLHRLWTGLHHRRRQRLGLDLGRRRQRLRHDRGRGSRLRRRLPAGRCTQPQLLIDPDHVGIRNLVPGGKLTVVQSVVERDAVQGVPLAHRVRLGTPVTGFPWSGRRRLTTGSGRRRGRRWR